MRKLAGIAALAAVALVGIGGSSRADPITVLDQIGPNPSYLKSETAYTDQIFGAPYNADNVAVVDNFSVTTPGTTLTEVDAAVLGFNNFTSADFAAITSVRVEIYSSLAAAASSLTGDVADIDVPKADISTTTPYGPDRYSALAQLSIDQALGVGTYYIAVIPALSFSGTGGAEIGVYASTYAGDFNACQVNPGGGFGFAGNENALGVNAAYRILGTVPAAVPEPSSLVLCGIAGAIGLAAARVGRRRA